MLLTLCRTNQWSSDYGAKMVAGAVAQIVKERAEEGQCACSIAPERIREMVLKSWLEQCLPAGMA